MTEKKIPTLLTIRQFAQKHPFLTENSIRWMLFKDDPGLEDCLVRVSRRVYINEEKFFDFLTNHKNMINKCTLKLHSKS